MKERSTFKKIYTCILIIGIALLLVLLIISLPDIISSLSNSHSVELDGFSINSLSEEDIVKGEKSTGVMFSTNYENGTSTGVENVSNMVDSDMVDFSCKKDSGYKNHKFNKSHRFNANFKYFFKFKIREC